MTNRTTPQEGEESSESRPTPDFSKFMVHNSYSNSISSPSAGGEEHRRLSRQHKGNRHPCAPETIKEMGLIDHLAWRIGGVRAGSGGIVWGLTHAGERLLFLENHTLALAKRFKRARPVLSGARTGGSSSGASY